MKPDVEDIVQAVLDVFQSDFAANLEVIDSAKAEPLNPQPPAAWYFGDTQNLPQLPAMLFVGRDTKQNQDNYGWREQTVQVEIEAYVAGNDLQDLARVMRRYGSAIDTTLRQNQTLGGLARNITNISQTYYNTMKGPPGLLQAVNVTFDVTVITD